MSSSSMPKTIRATEAQMDDGQPYHPQFSEWDQQITLRSSIKLTLRFTQRGVGHAASQ
jgi:hypothetical protein